MLSYKTWRSINESSINETTLPVGLKTPQSVGVFGGYATFDELLEAKKKMKKKMDFGGDVPMDDDDEEEDMDVDGAETGDGEVVDAKAPKDEPDVDVSDDEVDDDMGDEGDEDDEDDEEMDDEKISLKPSMMKKPPMMMKKKSSKKMKKENADFWNSLNNMMELPTMKNFDGIAYGNVSEDALLPPLDPFTGHVLDSTPAPGEVGFAPDTRIGSL